MSSSTRLRRAMRLPLISPRLWFRRVIFWVGAMLVAVVAIVFARAADWATQLCYTIEAGRPWLIFLVAPGGLAISVMLTLKVFQGAQGSGIPQTMAALHMTDQDAVSRILSLKVGIGKVVLTLLGLVAGASIGREGPTVQIGAAIMHSLGKFLRLPRLELTRALILAGGAAGIAGAFNTPLAGIVFAIEELSHSFESRTSGTVFTAVIIGGVTVLALAGNYTYFGHTSAHLDLGASVMAVIGCSVIGGLAGGAFSAMLVLAAKGIPGPFGRFVVRQPLAFAVLCGLGIAVLGFASHGQTYGTGYAQARALVEGKATMPMLFPVLKLLATVVSYVSGIPGGIFAPSLAVGAGIGHWLEPLVPPASAGAVVLLGMVAYFSGVVQAPITAVVIVMEMTDNQDIMVPLMATSFLAFGLSRLICRRPIYSALARSFLAAQERH